MSEKEGRVLANHVQKGVAVGGRLTIDAEKLSFKPAGHEEVIRGVFRLVGFSDPAWVDKPEHAVIRLREIASVGKTERSLKGLYAGSGRERLLIKLKDGTEEVFVVNNLEKLIAQVSGLLPE